MCFPVPSFPLLSPNAPVSIGIAWTAGCAQRIASTRFDNVRNGPTRTVDHNSFCFRARRHVRTSANLASSSPAKFQFNNFHGPINATRIKARPNKVLIPQMQDKRDNNKYGYAFFCTRTEPYTSQTTTHDFENCRAPPQYTMTLFTKQEFGDAITTNSKKNGQSTNALSAQRWSCSPAGGPETLGLSAQRSHQTT